MSMTYSVIGRSIDAWKMPRQSLEQLRSVHKTLGAALAVLPVEMDTALPPEYAYNLDHLYTLLQKVEYLVPDIADVYLCGYSWGSDGRAWTTWSGHEDKRTADRWLEAWKQSQINSRHHDDNWEVRRGDCQLGRFMPKGTRIATVMKVVDR